MLLNCGVGEDSWGSLGLQGDPTSLLKEISPEYSLEGPMLKLKLQYFGHPMWRTDSLEKTLMLGKIEGKKEGDRQRMRWLNGIIDWWTWVWASSESWWWTEKPRVLQSMGPHRVGHEWVTELNWCTSYYRRRNHFTFSFSFMLPNLNKHTVSPYLHQWHFLFVFQPQLSHLFLS